MMNDRMKNYVKSQSIKYASFVDDFECDAICCDECTFNCIPAKYNSNVKTCALPYISKRLKEMKSKE